ncbi:MAG: VWA domain-containing protein, partial [Acidobacteriota bacterium]|nr:VWA domain-containing protein [Acidobacteriota bacterium]
MRLKIFFIVLIIVSVFSGDVFAQDKDDEVLRVDTQLVDVPIVITDKAGKPVLNLKQNNFVIYEDGKRQETADFAATNAPFEVALLLDTSGSTRSDLALIQRAAENFINSLRSGDRVSIIAFRSSMVNNKSTAASEVLNALTDDRAKLKEVLAQVKTSNGTPYYDGLMKVVETVFKDTPKDDFRGRRALVALTDGVDSTSVSEFEEARA